MEIELMPSQQQEFNYLSFSHKNKVIRGTFPDFLIIGPQRTGTTWLAKNMRLHPEIFHSSPKELYFFNRLESGAKKSRYFHNFNNKMSMRANKNLRGLIREVAKVFYMDFWVTGNYNANELEWYLRFFDKSSMVNKRHGEKIKKLYNEQYAPTTFGEATASYAAMEPRIIEEILQINPDLKAILMVRDPVQRAWSHAKKDLARNKDVSSEDVRAEDYIEFLQQDYLMACGRYTQQIANWSRYLKPGNLLIGQYEDISKEPVDFLKNIYSFLNVSQKEKYIGKDVDKRINPSGGGGIPSEVKSFLANVFAEEIELLKKDYGIEFS